MYAPIQRLYEALDEIMREIKSKRGVSIVPIYIPRNIAWQRGPSQLLWIALHTIGALSHERDNLYIDRFLVLLENLHHYIWCAECKYHWRTNGGATFHSYLRSLPLRSRENLDIDISLSNCHNFVTATIGKRDAFEQLETARMIIEYREFAANGLLDRTYFRDETASLFKRSKRNSPTSSDCGETTLNRLRRRVAGRNGPRTVVILGV